MPEEQSNYRDPVLISRRLSRRAALLGFGALGVGLAGVSVSGCTSEKPAKSVEQVVGSDPLGPLYTETISLIGAYDQAIGADPTAVALGQLRDEHRQHALALAGLMGAVKPAISAAPNASGASSSPGAGVPSPAVAAAASLSDAEKTAQANAVAACKTASGARVAVLAAIAACRASHVAALGAMR